jgi:hypothetical protein
MSSIPEEFYRRTNELFALYERVKLCIIYAENFDPKDELYIAPINQLRSALDHFFKASVHPDDMDYELKEAQEHLDRAGYDAFEILASNLGKSIVDKLAGYDTDVLTEAFPEYYQVIRPKLIEVRANLAEIRKKKKHSKNGVDDSFSSYFDQVLLLLDYNKTVESHIPSIEEYKKKKKRERRKERLFNVVIVGILCAIIGGLAVYFAIKWFDNQKEPEKSKTEVAP